LTQPCVRVHRNPCGCPNDEHLTQPCVRVHRNPCGCPNDGRLTQQIVGAYCIRPPTERPPHRMPTPPNAHPSSCGCLFKKGWVCR
jgi:hypothetical protein